MADDNKQYKEAIDLTAQLDKNIKKTTESFGKGGEAHKKQLGHYKIVVEESIKAANTASLKNK